MEQVRQYGRFSRTSNVFSHSKPRVALSVKRKTVLEVSNEEINKILNRNEYSDLVKDFIYHPELSAESELPVTEVSCSLWKPGTSDLPSAR